MIPQTAKPAKLLLKAPRYMKNYLMLSVNVFSRYTADIKGDLLIVQGSKDPNVTKDNVAAVTNGLRRENIPFELITFEDEGHGIARPKYLRVLYPRLADFFHKAFQVSS